MMTLMTHHIGSNWLPPSDEKDDHDYDDDGDDDDDGDNSYSPLGRTGCLQVTTTEEFVIMLVETFNGALGTKKSP